MERLFFYESISDQKFNCKNKCDKNHKANQYPNIIFIIFLVNFFVAAIAENNDKHKNNKEDNCKNQLSGREHSF